MAEWIYLVIGIVATQGEGLIWSGWFDFERKVVC